MFFIHILTSSYCEPQTKIASDSQKAIEICWMSSICPQQLSKQAEHSKLGHATVEPFTAQVLLETCRPCSEAWSIVKLSMPNCYSVTILFTYSIKSSSFHHMGRMEMNSYIYFMVKLVIFTSESDQFGLLVIFNTALLCCIFFLHKEKMF